jgi:hypothetical protein
MLATQVANNLFGPLRVVESFDWKLLAKKILEFVFFLLYTADLGLRAKTTTFWKYELRGPLSTSAKLAFGFDVFILLYPYKANPHNLFLSTCCPTKQSTVTHN